MKQMARIILIFGGGGMLLLAAIFCFRQELAARLWMWTDSPLSFFFLAAMQAAIAAAMLWIGFSGELAALAPGALNLVIMLGGSAISLAYVAGVQPGGPELGFAFGCGLFALFNAWLYRWARRQPLLDDMPMPRLLWISYVLFVIVLAGVGGAMLLGVGDIMPWGFGENNRFTPVIFGWMFFGDAFYFLYALLFPRWRNACAQLCSFLAYDLVLLGPFLMRWPLLRDFFPGTPRLPDHLLDNLVVYTLILIYSAALGVYYLLLDPRTRLLGGTVIEPNDLRVDQRTAS